MKVSEAKEKVCPFIQHIVVASSDFSLVDSGIDDYSYSNIKCICGDCMAWQYIKVTPSGNTFDSKEATNDGYCKRIRDEAL